MISTITLCKKSLNVKTVVVEEGVLVVYVHFFYRCLFYLTIVAHRKS